MYLFLLSFDISYKFVLLYKEECYKLGVTCTTIFIRNLRVITIVRNLNTGIIVKVLKMHCSVWHNVKLYQNI